MRASGNGNIGVCANNLLKIFRGENPYERVKGLDPRNIDRPGPETEALMANDAEWCIGVYEPRATITGITIESGDQTGDGARIVANIAES